MPVARHSIRDGHRMAKVGYKLERSHGGITIFVRLVYGGVSQIVGTFSKGKLELYPLNKGAAEKLGLKRGENNKIVIE